jgi:peptide deformylase
MKKWLVFNYKIDLYSTIMAKLTIQTWETNDILRTLSTPILQNELRKYRSLAEDMIKYIKNSDNGWVGLAAPQVWVNKRLIVVSLMKTYDDESFRTIALINPEIIEHSEERCSESEWCLSVPGESGDVERWTWIKVNFLDIEWKKYSLHLTDLAARIVQHEIDHLDGILFVDKVHSSIFNTNTTL